MCIELQCGGDIRVSMLLGKDLPPQLSTLLADLNKRLPSCYQAVC